ncbi:MAG TPA: transglutaminase-like cysteine peptidase [Alphaproteobacteria bacterium]
MPDYNSDLSAFKKFSPVAKWLSAQPIKISASTGAGPVAALCDTINRQVNTGFIYMRDGLSNVWYTPPQFVKAHGGDCEDFSIYKMYKLSQAGIPLVKQELVICTDKQSREYHCVLRVFAGTSQYILDNQNAKLWTKESFNARYAPIYALSTAGWRICTA